MSEPSKPKIPTSEAEAKLAYTSCMMYRNDLHDQIKHLSESRQDSRIVPGAIIDMSTLVKTDGRKLTKINSDDDRANVALNVRYTTKSLEACLMIRRLILEGGTNNGITLQQQTKKFEHWIKRLENINWSFERATDAIGFLSYLQINGEYPRGECAVELRHVHPAGSTTCIDENHAITQDAWEDWMKELPADCCGCAETSALVRIIGAVLLEGNPYRPENQAKTVQFISRGLEMGNPGKAWVAEGRMPSSRKGLKPFELWLGLDDEDQTKFRLWIWVDRLDGERHVWHLRMEGKLGTLMPTGTIFEDDDDVS
ncbi:hypothetical protein LTR95_007096 [Oleoguttula sp. CCFEE 5521]